MNEVNGQIAAAKKGGLILRVKAGTAKKRTDTGEQFTQLKGLGDIVVPTAVQAADNIYFFIRGSQKDNGNPAVSLAYLGTDVKTSAVRKCYVQKKECVSCAAIQKFSGLGRGFCDIQRKAVFLQGVLKAVYKAVIIL